MLFLHLMVLFHFLPCFHQTILIFQIQILMMLLLCHWMILFPPPMQICQMSRQYKRNYDTNRKFKEFWHVKLPWTRFYLGSNGSLHTIKCKIYSKVERKDKILATKWDSFCKHVGWQKVLNNIGINVKKGEWYYSKYCKHTKKPYIVYFLYSINYCCLTWKWGCKKEMIKNCPICHSIVVVPRMSHVEI